VHLRLVQDSLYRVSKGVVVDVCDLVETCTIDAFNKVRSGANELFLCNWNSPCTKGVDYVGKSH
jgi:hypothetical protein